MKKVMIVTDCVDIAYNEIHATITNLLENSNNKYVILPCVKAKEFSVINGSFLMRLMCDIYNPKDLIILAILNPLKTNTKDRARICGKLKNGITFVGANTGIFNWIIEDFGLDKLFEFKKEGLSGKDFVSFGGKYYHAPLVAKIIMGQSLNLLGEPRPKEFLSKFVIPKGSVLHIDNFGVLKIKGYLEDIKEGEKIDIFVNNLKKDEATLTSSMKDLEDGTMTIFRGSSLGGLFEIARVRKLDTYSKLGANIGDIVSLKRDITKK